MSRRSQKFFVFVIISILLINKFSIANAESYKDLLFQKGLNLLDSNDYYAAIIKLTKFIQYNNKNPVPYINRGAAFYYTKQYKNAIKDYTKAISVMDENNRYKSKDKPFDSNGVSVKILAYLYRGTAYYQMSMFEEAKSDFISSINSNPCSENSIYCNTASPWLPLLSEAYTSKGDVNRSLNLLDSAIEDYTTSIKFYPDNIHSYLNRSTAFYEGLDYSRALEDVQKVIDNLVNLENVNDYLARAYNKKGVYLMAIKDFQKSIDSFKKGIQYKTNNGDLNYNLGLVYRDLDRNDLALNNFIAAAKIYKGQADNSNYLKSTEMINKMKNLLLLN